MFIISALVVIAVGINMFIIFTWFNGKAKDQAIDDVKYVVDDVVDELEDNYESVKRKVKYHKYMWKYRNKDFVEVKNYKY